MATTAHTRRKRTHGPAPGRKPLLWALAVLILATLVVASRHRGPLQAPLPHDMAVPSASPLAYWPGREDRYASRALSGEAHPLFVASPGGAVATAARVAKLRRLVDAATAGTGISPDLLEALVFVESAGRTTAMAGGSPANAAGLTQILPSTAATLGLPVDVGASERLTAAIDGAGSRSKLASLSAQRRRVDPRFDPARALAATVRYLQQARARFGREDLAFVSYHMGMGNLTQVLDAYDGGRAVPYTQLFFDTAPGRHAAAFQILSGFADQSSLYFWRLLGAQAIMRLYRSDPTALAHLSTLQTDADSDALVLHPPSHTASFADASALADAYGGGALVPMPANARRLGLSLAPSIGDQARALGVPAGLYRGLRPSAMTALLTLATQVRALSGVRAPLVVTSAVTDRRYQARLGGDDPAAEAGWSFTLSRHYAGQAQAQAVQTVLDRLQALNLVAWTAYPSELEVTVASDAGRVLTDGP